MGCAWTWEIIYHESVHLNGINQVSEDGVLPVQREQMRRYSAEDMALPGVPEKFVELIEGELVQTLPPHHRHNRVAFNIARMFDEFCNKYPGLHFGGDNNGFLIQRNPDTLLSPAASLFRANPYAGTTWLEFAPEVVVEIRSSINSATEMVFKRHRYFEAGTEQFWLVDPESRLLEIHHSDGRILRADGAAIVEGEGIAEGLTIALGEIFHDR